MGKLHEVLAVDRDLEKISDKMIEEAMTTFTKRTDHFTGSIKRLEMFDESRKQEEAGFQEIKEIVTTVDEKLRYVAESWVKHIDAIAQKEATNMIASATLYLPDGATVPNVPATVLLALEGKLTKLRNMYEAIPTLPPGMTWEKDFTMQEGVFKAKNDEVRHKTEKTLQSKILVQATDKHPAQVEKWTADEPVGQYVTTRWCSMVTPARKNQLIGKIDALLAEVKKARMRANMAEVVEFEIGKRLIDFINM